MILNLWNIIILLGVIQGIISTVLLFRVKSNKVINRLLAWIILLISMASLNIFLLENLEGNYSVFWSVLEALFPLVIIMPVGPLISFYTKSLLNPQFEFSRKNRLHFYPVLLDLMPNIMALVYILGVLFKAINPQNNEVWGNYIAVYNMYIDIPRWISMATYLWLTYTMINEVKMTKQKTEHYEWAKKLVYGFLIFQIIWLFHLVFYLIPVTSGILLNSVGWYPVYIPLIVMVYWLGINGYLIGNTITKPFQTSVLKPEIVEETLKSLETVMKRDRLFLDASLKLSDIVKHTGNSQKVISAVLNQHLGKSFNEYVNEFRVNEFKARLLNPKYQHLTITGIAFECGFNSQATFQRTFKSITKQSPSEFRQANSKKSK